VFYQVMVTGGIWSEQSWVLGWWFRRFDWSSSRL